MTTNRFISGGFYVERIDRRDGPSPTFIVCHKHQAWIETNPWHILKKCRITKGLPTRAAFVEWLEGLEAGKSIKLGLCPDARGES